MGGDQVMAAKLKRGCGCAGNCDSECNDGCCISGGASGTGSGTDQTGPCADFLNASTNEAKYDGVYSCLASADDEGTWTWPGGSHYKPAFYEPYVGPCYGAGSTSFIAILKEGDKVKCKAGSWGGDIGCNMTCCIITAP